MSKEYLAFKKLYVEMQMKKHSDNPAWSTFDEAYELLGGDEDVCGLFGVFQLVSNYAQKAVCGFTMDDVYAAMA